MKQEGLLKTTASILRMDIFITLAWGSAVNTRRTSEAKIYLVKLFCVMVSSELQAVVKHFIKMLWECTRKLLTVMFAQGVSFESSA